MRAEARRALACAVAAAGLAWPAGQAASALARPVPAGEHARRVAAELVVVAGDARRLAQGAALPLERAGLRARIAGSLASLPLLLRHAGSDAEAVPVLRAAAARGDWSALGAALRTLQRAHPFDPGALASAPPTPERLALGKAIHAQSCAACHDAPAADAALPARDLYAMARSAPRAEFAARLLLGVRGDRSTAYRNPFSDLELGALLAWYVHGARAGGG